MENLVKQNNIIEGHKDSLSLCTDVNLTDLFDFFDKSNMNCISNVDMKQTLIELVYVKVQQILITFMIDMIRTKTIN